jgi:hypothetical protein
VAKEPTSVVLEQPFHVAVETNEPPAPGVHLHCSAPDSSERDDADRPAGVKNRGISRFSTPPSTDAVFDKAHVFE